MNLILTQFWSFLLEYCSSYLTVGLQLHTSLLPAFQGLEAWKPHLPGSPICWVWLGSGTESPGKRLESWRSKGALIFLLLLWLGQPASGPWQVITGHTGCCNGGMVIATASARGQAAAPSAAASLSAKARMLVPRILNHHLDCWLHVKW